MASLESQIQKFVHALEQGSLSKIIKWGAGCAAVLALSLVFLFIKFSGFSEPVGMDQAQVARNLARGDGFSTSYIRPLALWQLQKNEKGAPKVSMPDTYNAPLNPLFNAVLLKPFQSFWTMSSKDQVYLGDRVIAGGAIVLFLLSVFITFLTIKRLFDTRIALLSAGLLLVCHLFWQFSLSGLPQMLMLLFFSSAIYTMVRAVQAAYESTPIGLWLGASGLLFGLLTLTHALGFWIFLGALVFAAIFFKPRFISALLMLGFFMLIVTPWLARNYTVSGSPFGISIYSALDNIQQSESGWMRESAPSFKDVRPGIFRLQMQSRLVEQFNALFESLGWSIVAPVFFVALLHLFRRKDASVVRWLILATWIGAVFGMTLFGIKDSGVGANQLHVLFIPMMTAYGIAFLLVLWTRLPIDYSIVRISFLTLVYLVCAIPMILKLLPGGSARFHWPPYLPPLIAILGEWMEPREIIASDMPWAVAWYADRKGLLLPKTPAELTRLHDYELVGAPINGLYLTPVTGNEALFKNVIKGEYKDWAPFILRSPASIANFHLTAAVPLPPEGEIVFFSDRDRWSTEGINVPDSLKSEGDERKKDAEDTGS